MAFITKKTDELLSAGTAVENAPGRPDYVVAGGAGPYVGLVLDGAPTYGGTLDDPVIDGYTARIIYGPGAPAVAVSPPDGYDGEIIRFKIVAGVITLTTRSDPDGVGYLAGLNPTWATWG